MSRLHINKLIISGDKGISTIEFGERLTIIAGPSDTGKSYIYKCIYYLFGAKEKDVPFDKSIGYDTISMEIRKGTKDVTIKRKIGSNAITVSDGNTTTEYKISGKNDINSFYCDLIGVPSNLKVPKNQDGQTQRFTWKTLKPLVMVHEDDTEIEKPILTPENITASTPFLSCLLYLLYDQDFSEFDAEENKKTKAAKKAAVQKYIIGNKEKLLERKKALEEIVNSRPSSIEEITELVNKLQEELDSINELISSVIYENTKLGNEIISTEDSIRKTSVMLDRYKALESQYTADIERLGFIVEGEKVIHDIEKPVVCPFCSNNIQHEHEESFLESSKAEVQKIFINISDLLSTITSVEADLTDANEKLQSLYKQKKQNDEKLNNDLKPKKQSIVERINDYTSFVESVQELKTINDLLSSFERDLSQLEQTVDERRPYKPKELFAENFATKIGDYYFELLRACNFTPLLNAKFDMDTFDIIVNDEAKRTHGKGYRALLNSLVILSMRKYMNEVAVNNPHFYFIDSPLHGLQMPNGVEATANVRKGFFNYLINNYENDQIIIIENINPDDLPENVRSDENVKFIEFTQNESNGRYGLLNGIKKN